MNDGNLSSFSDHARVGGTTDEDTRARPDRPSSYLLSLGLRVRPEGHRSSTFLPHRPASEGLARASMDKIAPEHAGELVSKAQEKQQYICTQKATPFLREGQ